MSKRLLTVLGLVLLALAGFVMWQNHTQASKTAAAIEAADKTGNDQTVAVASLKTYVASHMGSSVTVSLAAAYARAQAAAALAAQASAANAQIYADAQRVCSGKSDSIVQARCNQDYLAKHLVALPPSDPIVAPDPANYVYKLKAPLWFPDLAGALLVGGIVALIWVVISSRRRRRKGY